MFPYITSKRKRCQLGSVTRFDCRPTVTLVVPASRPAKIERNTLFRYSFLPRHYQHMMSLVSPAFTPVFTGMLRTRFLVSVCFVWISFFVMVLFLP